MGILDKLSRFFSSSSGGDEDAYWVYVRCSRCDEKLRTRISLYNDLSVDFNNGGEIRYICRKTLVGSQRCFQRIEVILYFDSQRVLTDRDISGGMFIDEDEYLADEG
jgi:hypothetical protein